MQDLSTTEAGNSPLGGDPVGTGLDNYLRSIQAIVRTTNAKGADIASAATTNIGAATGEFVTITGTTTITSFGTVDAGIVRTLHFSGALTITHNSTSLILPGSSNISTAAGDVAMFRSLGSGNWRCVGVMRASSGGSGGAVSVLTVAAMKALTDLVDGALVQPAEYYFGDGFRPSLRRFIVDAAPPADNGGTVIRDNAGVGYFSYDSSDAFNVLDFGARSDGADAYSAFQSAIDALPSGGGKITVPGLAFVLGTTPNIGARSVFWDISPSATFSGAGTGVGKFPYMGSNTSQMAVGPFIQSRTTQKSADANGGVAALSVEMLQPDAYGAGQSVALYAAAKSNNANAGGNSWAINCLIEAESSSAGTYQCIEVDVDCFSSAALMKGISITGIGSQDPDVALEIVRAQGKWTRGIFIDNAQDQVVLRPVSGGRAIIIGTGVPAIGDTAITTKQLANAADTILVQRDTDTTPTGQLFRAVNAANTQNIVILSVTGDLTLIGKSESSVGVFTGGTPTPEVGKTKISAATAATVGAAGGASALPATPLGYLHASVGAVNVKIPYYSA